MIAERDFDVVTPTFFSTSNIGGDAPAEAGAGSKLKDAYDIKELSKLDALVTCQGSDYTKRVYPELRKSGWNGYFIDAASTLRMDKEAIIILDPVNRELIDSSLKEGIKTFVGGNCTVSLLIMALGGILHRDIIEWISSATYQAASGAGAKNMLELMNQMTKLGSLTADVLKNPAATALTLEREITLAQRASNFPCSEFGAPLAGSLIPWVDSLVEGGQTREEWKAEVELNKILMPKTKIPVDGLCVRVGVLRCHSQAVTIKLKQNLPIDELEGMIAEGNEWVRVIKNTPEDTRRSLTPTAVSGTLNVSVGRIHKLRLGKDYLGLFTVGDQLLWGAAEPLRRMVRILVEK
jgi:aspartate-semialdehyde dehydrogenase